MNISSIIANASVASLRLIHIASEQPIHIAGIRNHEERPEAECCHGYFTGVVEASSMEKALDKFELLLRRLRRTSTVFDGLESVYLDSCTEIGAVPKNGFLPYFVEIRGESLGEISTELVGVGGNKVNAYHVVKDHAKDAADSSVLEPFLTFGQ